MKKLIFEYTDKIEARKKYASELVNALNTVLTSFKSTHNHFGQGIDENFTFELISNPLSVFDSLVLANSPIKQVAGRSPDIEKLCQLVNIDRDAFISDLTMIRPGSQDQYNRTGTIEVMKLREKDRHLVSWSKDHFILNDQALAAECEAYKVYAEDPEAVELVKWYEDLCKKLNEAKERRILYDVFTCNQVADKLGVKYERAGKYEPNSECFKPDFKELARTIKAMVPVN